MMNDHPREQKTILVTGGAGFIGTNFILRVLETRPGWRVVNLDALTYAGNRDNFKHLPSGQADRYRFVHGFIQHAALLSTLFEEETFAAVFHFAAQTHVDRSIVRPEDFIDTNITGTFCLLEVCREQQRREKLPPDFRFIHISTDEVYGSLGPVGSFTEETPYDPSSPYSAAKAASDHLVTAWCRTYGLPAIVTNCSNNFGPYQYPEKLIPLIINNIIRQKELPVYGDGKNVRDWLYVTDHCDALLRVFDRGLSGDSYVIGGGTEQENIVLVRLLCDTVDERLGRDKKQSSRSLIRFVADRPGHDRRYAIDSTKIRNNLGWFPAHNFETALAKTVDWYLANRKWLAEGEQEL